MYTVRPDSISHCIRSMYYGWGWTPSRRGMLKYDRVMAAKVNPNYETTFDSYSFEYQWKISKVSGRLSKPDPLICPETITSPPGKLPVTMWTLQALGKSIANYPNYHPVTLTFTKGVAWVRVRIGVFKVNSNAATQSLGQDNSPQHAQHVIHDLYVTPSCSEPNTIERSYYDCNKNSVIGFISKSEFFKYLIDDSLTIYCHIFVNRLNAPVHVKNIPAVEAMSSQFDLSKLLEDARHKEKCTDVTIVTSEKEFKAHKVVLVSQSAFFETRLEERWTEHGGNRIEMRDVPAVTMDTILSYMYTGKVVDIDKAAHELLPRADEYQLDGLKTLCEEALCKSLTAQSVIDILVMADTHNAPTLKQSCLTFIAKNISDVKKSSAWTEGKLKSEENKDLWAEVMEHIVKSL